MAGFEGADHINRDGLALDMPALTGHDRQARGDYRRARALGVRTVRESIGWRTSAGPGGFDFRRAVRWAAEAQRQGVEVLWSLWHYGMPGDVDPFAPAAVARFERFAVAAARAVAPFAGGALWINPINEISFLAWLLTEGRTGAAWTGRDAARARALKENLCRAAIRACAAIRDALPQARFFHTDPVIHVVWPNGDANLEREARGHMAAQWEAWDLLCDAGFEPGVPPPERVALIGINHYHASQWIVPSRKPLRWHLGDPRRRPLADLAGEVYARYGHPLFIGETSHFGIGRGDWLRDIGRQVDAMQAAGVPVAGACIYPFVDRPDWDQPGHWHRSGLWDLIPTAGTRGPRRVPAKAACAAFAALDPSRLHHSASERTAKGSSMDALIVFSHLRWDAVWQRPQHLVTRFARRFRVLFVEEPAFADGPPRAERVEVHPNVTLLRPHTAIPAPGFHDDQLPAIRPLIEAAIRELGCHRYGVYTFTPMALPLMQDLDPVTIAYDCMDELAAFRFAPKQLPQRESALFRAANLVLTGGPSLYRSKRKHHHDVHCFPSSVDARHFAAARRASIAHADVAKLPRPRLGFYGVIDERLDIDFVGRLAQARPDWQWVLVGPVVKIDPATLPQAANLHWLPQQPYAALPSLIAGWDVCLLPFARNEHTRFISPTKTLEYLAADKPVVSTSVADVAELYGEAVRFADEVDGFVAACEQLLAESDAERETRIKATRALVQRGSWDTTAGAIADLLEASAREGLRGEARALFAGTPARRASARPRDVECLVVGAGPTGLSAAYHYGAGATLLEREASVGGWCRSIEAEGFTFDCAGHIMFSNDAYVHELYRLLLGDNVIWQDREAWIYSKRTYTRYPFQGSLYGLPPDVLKECLVGAIEARFGPLAGSGPRARHEDCCADGTAIAGVVDAGSRPGAPAPRNFEEFIHAVWGAGIAKHFALPYNRKLWSYPLTEMETSWLGGRVPLPDLEQMIDGALKPAPKPMGPNARFGYPRQGGFQALMDGFLPHLQGPLEMSADVVAIKPGKRLVTLADGRTYRYDALIATLPLPELVRMIGDEAPPDVRAAAARLRRVSVRCVNLGVGRAGLSDKHWIYYPEDTVFHRVFLQGNASPGNNAPGGFALTCEISYSPVKPLPCAGDALIERCRRDLTHVGLLRDDDPILCANEVDMPYAYVLYDHQREAAVRRIREWLAPQGVVLAGRYAEWAYYNSDHAFIAGRDAARQAAALIAAPAADAAIA